MNRDTDQPLSAAGTDPSQTLLSKILEIQRKAQSIQIKATMQLCIQTKPVAHNGVPASHTATPIELQHHTSNEYIAVSCPWQLGEQHIVSGRYKFVPEQTDGIMMPQDIVLDRIINFKACNPEYKTVPFWIDKLCINQNASDLKESAVNSMDLVYHYSRRSLGLLFVQINSLDHLNILRNLLDGRCAEMRREGAVLLISPEEVCAVLEVIEMIIKDDWWRRAWIFQEEFLASSNMTLLLPCSVDRGKLFLNEENIDPFGTTSGEIEVYPLNFRTEASTFCLALINQADTFGNKRCSDILKVVRRYTTLFRGRAEAGSLAPLTAMLPAIVEDINSRGISIPSDILAITANCCRYPVRLNAGVLNAAGESLSMALLALVLMNGEIFRHNSEADEVLGKTVASCLYTEKLHIHPPVSSKELIFIRHCHFSSPRLATTGIVTNGVLSCLDKSIIPKVPATLQDKYWKFNNPEETLVLTPIEGELLQVFAQQLYRDLPGRCVALVRNLRRFASAPYPRGCNHSKSNMPLFWSWYHLKVMMAKRVCRAIAERQKLWLARAHIPGTFTPYLGIFVPESPVGELSSTFAFSSLGQDTYFKEDGKTLATKTASCVSLEVEFTTPGPWMVPKQWMNGLCFFSNKELRNWIFPWPNWMEKCRSEADVQSSS